VTLWSLSTLKQQEDYTDRALIEYTAASFHFEQAGHRVYCACVENNMAVLFLNVGKCAEAHEHLDRARKVLAGLKDNAHTAQVDETRARVLLAEGRNEEAERFAAAAVRALEKGGEQSILAEALTSYGIALARLGDHTRAHIALQRAVTVAEEAGASAIAGRAALTVIEELSGHAPRGELCDLFREGGRPALGVRAAQRADKDHRGRANPH
jgi:tetratricopeptide (TPR) repeat protein